MSRRWCCNEKNATILSRFTQKIIEKGFYKFGLYSYNNPIKLIILATIFSLAWTAPIYLLTFEFRFFYMVVPRTSEVWDQNEFAINNFGEPPSILQLTLYNKQKSILKPDIMNTSYNIFNDINNIESKYEDKLYKYGDLCVRDNPDDPYCLSAITSLFAVYFENNPQNWKNESNILDSVNTLNPLFPIKYFLGTNDVEYNTENGDQYIRNAYSLLINYEGMFYVFMLDVLLLI